ncbi:SdiA-regulated domain-containing protein [Pseudocitrobacter cyperus]|uniref:SdiA-regulated domain-containing protein n=1 Tax=Pseudocitrobacter cyperus TaxID=3112843 RepID=A0ABV0HM68_9ENTR
MKNKKTKIFPLFIIFIVCIFSFYYYITNYPRIDNYRVTIDAKQIPDLHGGLSGLTWNHDTQTLFAVTDAPSLILELAADGKVLRRIETDKPADLEAIEYIGNQRFYLSKEKSGTLAIITITDATQKIDISHAETYRPDIQAKKKNSGVEGLAWKPELSRMVTAQEKKPIRIFNILDDEGAFKTGKNPLNELMLSWYVRDISGMDFDGSTSDLYILSDISQKVVVVDKEHKLKFMQLKAGHYGLARSIPQPEGIATDGRGNLYIVSEPNLFYKFSQR